MIERFKKLQIIWFLIALVCVYVAYLLGKSGSSGDESSHSSSTSRTSHPFIKSKKPERDWVDVTLQKDVSPKKLKANDNKNFKPDFSKNNLKKSLPLIPTQKDKISEFIAQAQPEEIDFYLGQYFSDDILLEIRNKRGFSERLLQEYSKIESFEKNIRHGDVAFSTDQNLPQEIRTNFNLSRKQKMYAHLKLNGSLENSGAIFIRWVSLADEKVLLFERKPINSNSHQNWVSFKPKRDWKEGAYLVTYYSFDSMLKVIAQNIYQIDYVGN